MEKMRVVFFDREEDERLLKACVKALETDVLSTRYEYSVERDDTAKTTTLRFWRRTGVADAQ